MKHHSTVTKSILARLSIVEPGGDGDGEEEGSEG